MPKNKRLYAPHIKVGGRWQRVEGKGALPKERAVIFYQDWLLGPALGGSDEVRELRPIKPNTPLLKGTS